LPSAHASLMTRRPPRSTPFPYPTLFRSRVRHGTCDAPLRADVRSLARSLALAPLVAPACAHRIPGPPLAPPELARPAAGPTLDETGRAHVCNPGTHQTPIPSSAFKNKIL